MDITINGSMKEVEEALRALVRKVFHNPIAEVIDTKTGVSQFRREGIGIDKATLFQGVVVLLRFTDKVYIFEKARFLNWGQAMLTEQGDRTTISIKLLPSNIMEYCKKDLLQYEKKKGDYEEQMRTLTHEVIETFRADRKIAEPSRPKLGASVDQFLDYREKYYQATGMKITYKMLATMSNYKEGTFKQAARYWKLKKEKT